jgi:hypothetical protein
MISCFSTLQELIKPSLSELQEEMNLTAANALTPEEREGLKEGGEERDSKQSDSVIDSPNQHRLLGESNTVPSPSLIST